ncbi:MAG: ATP-binding protein [Acidobacteria bacterium]|nr:MAG: ATP-binding protein [Acidobacteriota bacterium]
MIHQSLSFIELNFSSSLAILDLIQPIANRMGEQLGFSEDDRYWTWLAIQEALNNAVRHGNKMEADKQVTFRIDMVDESLIIQVKDQGEGFDPESIPDPTAPDNLLKSSGRGLFYMYQFMDEVTIETEDGTMVTMIKRVPNAGSG